MRLLILLLPFLVFAPAYAVADMSAFTPGPVIENYGQVANVEVTVAVPEDAVFRHSFDVSGEAPASADLVATLVDHGVRIYVCGQTAAYYSVATDDLLPGVDMALSAMTMHALLQQQGFTLNPF